MSEFLSIIFSGFVSKVINDITEIKKDRIKEALSDRNNMKISTKICSIIEHVLNVLTDNKYKNSDILYDTMESLFKGLKKSVTNIEAIKSSLSIVISDVDDEIYYIFLIKFFEEISKDDELYRVISIILQEQNIQYDDKEFKQLNENIQFYYKDICKKITDLSEKVNGTDIDEIYMQNKIENRLFEYAKKWNDNMFLNNFDKRDEKAGINIKLRDVYLDKQLPHYIWKQNKIISKDLKELLSEYINIGINENNKMLLILGQPGIGKSTLITWIIQNFNQRKNDFLVYKFSTDLKDILWNDTTGLTDNILFKLGLTIEKLNGKILILDGFDEINNCGNKAMVLNNLFYKFIVNEHYNKYKKNTLIKFSIIVTCRENYINNLDRVNCVYIKLQVWDDEQIRRFCKIYANKTKKNITDNMLQILIRDKNVLGIPLILYMILALDVSIEKNGSIVDIYDQIFSSKIGAIYDRCIKSANFGEPHRISEIKCYIHQITQKIALWMFENNPDEASIPQREYEKICNDVLQEQLQIDEDTKQDFLIGNYFKLVKHCNGMDTDQLYFVHRTIYEYFVADTIYNAIRKSIITHNKEDFAKKIAIYLKDGYISYYIGEYFKYKVMSLYSRLESKDQVSFYEWLEQSVNLMLTNGMYFYTKNSQIKNIILKELRCFENLSEILRLLVEISEKKYIYEYVDKEALEKYIIFCTIKNSSRKRILGFENLNLSIMCLREINLQKLDLMQTNFKGADLTDSKLRECNLKQSNFQNAILERADLREADLREADLREADLREADLRGAKVADSEKFDIDGKNYKSAILKNAKLDGSIWLEEDMKHISELLWEASFDTIFVDNECIRKKLKHETIYHFVRNR